MALVDLVRVPIPYLLEVYIGSGTKPARVTTVPFGPSSMSVRTSPPVKIQRTLGRLPIRQHSRYSEWIITLSGRSGLRVRPGYDSEGQVAFKTGPRLLEDFSTFLKLYLDTADEMGAQYLENPDEYEKHLGNVRLVFRALKQNLHLCVEPTEFVYQSAAAGSRFSYEWTLTLEGYAEADYTPPDNVLGSVHDWTRDATRAGDAAYNTWVKGALVLSAVRSDLEVLRLPSQRMQTTLELLRQTVAAGQSLASFPLALQADLAVVAKQTSDAWERLYDAGKLPSEEATAGIATLQAFYAAQDTARDAMTAYGGMRGGPAGLATAEQAQDSGGPGGMASSPAPVSAEGKFYQLAPGESLKDVANKYLGSPELWTQIAYINGLPSPYHKSDGSPLLPGDGVLVPLPAGSTGADIGADVDLASLYGLDWYVDADGDFEVDASGSDFRTIDGLDNLRQALRLRMLTTQGTSGFPDYGLPVEPGDEITPQTAGYVAAHMREQLLREPRVAAVTDLQVIDEGDGLSVSAQIRPISSGAFTLTAPFPSAS